MSYDYTRLRNKIQAVFGTAGAFAAAIHLSEHSVSKKLNSKTQWKQDEILRACILLDIREQDIFDYFFTLKIQ